jgi:hypothetical protein
MADARGGPADVARLLLVVQAGFILGRDARRDRSHGGHRCVDRLDLRQFRQPRILVYVKICSAVAVAHQVLQSSGVQPYSPTSVW